MSRSRPAERMHSAHPAFDLFHALDPDGSRGLVFVSERTPDRRAWYEWIPIAAVRQVAYQSCTAVDMALCVLRARRPRAAVVFEHKPQYSLPLYAICVARRLPVFFFVHGLQQTSSRSTVHRLGFRLLQRLVARRSFWPLHLERGDDVLPARERFARAILVRHPLPPFAGAPRRAFDPARIVVGIVGMLRPDKPIAGTLARMRELCRHEPRFRLAIGTPSWQATGDLCAPGTEIVDTSTPEQYRDFLLGCDIVVTAFAREAFWFRPSGVISDALAAGCYVIAPDFPVLAAQLATPVRVGSTYDDEAAIADRVREAAVVLAAGVPDHAAWRAAREPRALVDALRDAIAQRVASVSP